MGSRVIANALHLFSPGQRLLACVCMMLACVLGYEISAPPGEFALPELHYARPAMDVFVANPVLPTSANAEIDARPLFSPLRSPLAIPGASGAASGSTGFPTDVTLVGVIIDGEKRIALVRTQAAGFAASETIGSAVEGWQVTQIEPDHIVLQSGSTLGDLRLESGRTPIQPSQSPPAAQSAQIAVARPDQQNPDTSPSASQE